jgi:glycosyltransferase involved in cell wall biosynthesis
MQNQPVKTAICILPRLKGLGGPVSFYDRLTTGLQAHGVEVLDDPFDSSCRAVLVVGGTRQVRLLLQARRKGIRIVQRLNGMNWMHRRRKVHWKYFLKAELNNALLSFTRRWLADRVVYQSNFARSWWRTVYKPAKSDGPVIYNGVDLQQFTPLGDERPPQDHFRLLLVEANVSGGYEMGLQNAIRLTEQVNGRASKPVELMVVGNVPEELQMRFQKDTHANIHWGGVVARGQVPAIDRSAHLLFSSDLNAACPNSVIEALACGLPVISFATGSLPELIQAESGKTVPYGSNYWKLEPPDIGNLAAASLEILQDQERFRLNARKRAEEAFSLEDMVQNYLDVLL